MKYNVWLGDRQIATGISGTSCKADFPADAELQGFEALVQAECNGKVSEKASSNVLPFGQPFKVPVAFKPTDEQAPLFTILDANGDGKGLRFVYMDVDTENYDIPTFEYSYSSENDADDWLFLPPVQLDDTTAVYNFDFNCFKVDSCSESFEVKLCTDTTPESAVKYLKGLTFLKNTRTDKAGWLKSYYPCNFNVPKAGKYYIGIHINSPKAGMKVYCRDFSVKKVDGMTTSGPKAPIINITQAGENGALEATTIFNMPTSNFLGQSYPADKQLRAVVCAEGCPEVEVTGNPGKAQTVKFTTKQGLNNVTVTCYDGNLKGLSATTTVFTGSEVPGLVSNLTITPDSTNMRATLKWNAPTAGADGGYLTPGGITYYLFLIDNNNEPQYLSEVGVDKNEVSVELKENAPQGYYRFGILTANAIGQCPQLKATGTVLGTPDKLPLQVNFSAGEMPSPLLNYTSGVTLKIGDPSTQYGDYGTDDNLKALYSYTTTSSYKLARFSIPKFSTIGIKKPAIRLHLYALSTPLLEVMAQANGVPLTSIQSFDQNDSEFVDWAPKTVTVDLPEQFVEKGWVEINFRFKTNRVEGIILYDYEIIDNVDKDLGVTALDAPAQAFIGQEARFVAHVKNFGNKGAIIPDYKWQITNAKGDVIASMTVPEAHHGLMPGEEAELPLAFTPDANQTGTFKVEFTLMGKDEKDSNNKAEDSFDVVKGTTPVVTDLHAGQITGEEVELLWTPISGAGQIVDSFEDLTPMVLDGESEMLGQFRRFDGDGKGVYGPQNDNYSKLPTAFKAQSYVVWSQEQMEQVLGKNSSFSAKSGDKFLIAFCPSDGSAADDWLISPEIMGGSDVSFAIKPLTYQYGAETIELMYSTKTDSPSDFVALDTIKVGQGGTAGSAPTFEEITRTLPENARYFAIHYVSKDIFGIIVDDVAYAPVGTDVEVTGYNVYRDGVMIPNEVSGNAGSYSDKTVKSETNYTYRISPNLSNGDEGALSNTLDLRTTGIKSINAGSRAVYVLDGMLCIDGYEGEGLRVVAAGGLTVATAVPAAAHEAFRLPMGVYVVKAGADTFRIMMK